MSFLSDRLEGFMVPKAIRIVDKLQKTFNGKILRKELKKQKEVFHNGRINSDT